MKWEQKNIWQLIVYLAIVHGWSLSTYDDAGLNFITDNTDYVIVHVSVFYVRAFLTIRNSRNSTSNQITVIESTWPENLLAIQSRVFPNDLSHAKSQCDCNGILQTIQTDVDRSDGLLWLLDNGSQYCPPKLILFDLLKGNAEVHRYVFEKLKHNAFKSIKIHKLIFNDVNDVDTIPSSSHSAAAITKYCALLLLHKQNFIVLYSIYEQRPRKLYFMVPNMEKSSGNRIKSKKPQLLTPNEITVKGDDEILISDIDDRLWMANLKQLKYSGRDLFVDVKYVGHLLGASKALVVPRIADAEISSNYLYYYLPRDGAVLRWNLRQPLTAEGHDVLYLTQSPVVQIVFGAKGSVWVVYKHADELGDHCRRILNFRGPLAIKY